MDVIDKLNDTLGRESGLDIEIKEINPVVQNKNVETTLGLIRTEDGWHELRQREHNGKAVVR